MAVGGNRSARRRRAGALIGVSVLAVLVVVALTLVLTKDEHNDQSLRDRVVDVEWTVISVDGVQVAAERPPTFTLQNDGRIVGFEGTLTLTSASGRLFTAVA